MKMKRTRPPGWRPVKRAIPDSAVPYLKNAYRGVGKRQVMDRQGCLLAALMEIKQTGIGGQILASGVARRLQDGEPIKELAGSLLNCVSIGRTEKETEKWKLPEVPK